MNSAQSLKKQQLRKPIQAPKAAKENRDLGLRSQFPICKCDIHNEDFHPAQTFWEPVNGKQRVECGVDIISAM